MDKDKALEICRKHLPVWLRYKKDSTTTDNSPQMWSELNLVHRFAFQQFEDLGCNDCISTMFRRVYAWYEREMAQVKEDPKTETPNTSIKMTFPEHKKKGK